MKVGAGYAGIGTTAPANGMIIQGNVGIGTTQPGYTFQVQVDASNQGHVNPDGSWSNGSDARIKTNVLTLTKGLGTVMGLRPVTYNSISDPTGERMGLLVGFIAQEVEESFPEAVDTDPVTGYKSISYTKFIPLLTSAIQEQEQKLALQEFTLSKVEGALRSWISESDSQQKTPPAESSLDSNSDELQPNLSSPYSIATSTPEFNIVSLASFSGSLSGATLSGYQSVPGFAGFLSGHDLPRTLATWLTDLVIDGYTLFRKSVVFAQSVLFQSPVHFLGSVFIHGHVMVGGDTAGIAVISQYTDTVSVLFSQPYEAPPLVTVSLTLKSATDSAAFLDEGHRAVVTDVSEKGFAIHVPEPALRDYEYNWVAISVKNPIVTKSSTYMSEVMAGHQTESGSAATPSASLTPAPTSASTVMPTPSSDSVASSSATP